MDINPLIDRRARNHKKNKRQRLDLNSKLDRKQIASIKRARAIRVEEDEDNDPTLYVR